MEEATIQRAIRIENATLHNLKHLSLVIPREQMVAITGISGSGKSTLAFDLIYEQGRLRYLRSIGMLNDLSEETGCERLSGLGPTVAVQQGIIRQSNPRSSVGTRSGIFTYLGLLYSSTGQRPCPNCGIPRLLGTNCPHCGQPAEFLTSGFFSYNSPLGMCLRCQGRGYLFELNLEKLLPTPDTTPRQMLQHAGSQTTFNYLLKNLFKEYADRPFREMPESARTHLLYGLPVGDGRLSHNLFDHLRWKLLKGRPVNDCIRHNLCPACEGERVSAETRQVLLAGQSIGRLGSLSLSELAEFFQNLERAEGLSAFSLELVGEISRRIDILCQNGLAHLTLYRDVPSLSGGELQRLFLSCHIDAQLDSLIYVLDEPTVGLHELEKQRLLQQLRRLQAQGNTILLVEHDPGLIAAADSIIDIGPLAGSAGGELIYQGDYAGLLAAPRSITGQFLSGQQTLPARALRTPDPAGPHLSLWNVSTNNLRGIDVSIPLGYLVGVAGVSGSGKSSLVMKTLVPLLEGCFTRAPSPADAEEIESEPEDGPKVQTRGRLLGAENLNGFSAVSQQPIGRHDNSNPATYLKIWDTIRKCFAATPAAQAQGLTPSDFSFNTGGACPICSGNGKQRIWLGGNFYTTRHCPACQGQRFRPEILKIRWQGKTILDVLALSAAEALDFFAALPAVQRVLTVLVRSGMGYLPLGQPAPSLSGGEAQRIKLAYEISRIHRNQTLYILDEPTIGLSLYDTGKLIILLDELLQKGNSILVVEHDPQVLARCDWIIELGPGGGQAGGQLIASGPPTALRTNPNSRIGPFLHV